MLTNKIYYNDEEIFEDNGIKVVYTIPNELQYVIVGVSDAFDNENASLSHQVINVISGSGTIKLIYPNGEIEIQNLTDLLIIPSDVKYSINGTVKLGIIYSPPIYLSDYDRRSHEASAEFIERSDMVGFMSDCSDRFDKEKMKLKYYDELIHVMIERNDMSETNEEGKDIFDYFCIGDPLIATNKYTEWIIQGYLQNGIKKLEDIPSRVKPALQKFILLSNKKLLSKGEPNEPWTNEYDLNNFIGLAGGTSKGRKKLGLEDLTEKYQDQLDSLETGKKQKVEIKEEGRKVVYDNEFARVIQPLTEQAACYYGKGTRWCTAGRENNMFEEYSKDGPLFIILPKNPSYKGEKYQYHHESNSYMNEKDEAVNPIDIFKKFGLEQEYKKITKLYLEKKDIIHPEIGNLENLQQLTINNHKISSILPEIKKLKNLRALYLFGTDITSIPEIGSLINLEQLILRNNQIKSIPLEINKLINLNVLDLSDNQITSIPPEIGTLPSLEELWLSDNQITTVPSEIRNLNKLKILNLSNNKLISIPAEIGELTNLKELFLFGNEIDIIPLEVNKLKARGTNIIR